MGEVVATMGRIRIFRLCRAIATFPMGVPVAGGEDHAARYLGHTAPWSRNQIARTNNAGVTETRLDGQWCPLYGAMDVNFYHFTMEMLPIAIGIIERFPDCGFIVSSDPRCRYSGEFLRLLGVPEEKIVLAGRTSYAVEELLFGERHHGMVLGADRGFIREVRDRVLGAIGGAVGADEAFRRVLVSRQAARCRRVTNFDELRQIAVRYGFEEQILEDMSLAEQIGLVRRAHAMVMPHGAALMHTLFMPERSLVVEMFAPNYVTMHALPICRALGHDYRQVVSPTGTFPVSIPERDKAVAADITANVQLVEAILEARLGVTA